MVKLLSLGWQDAALGWALLALLLSADAARDSALQLRAVVKCRCQAEEDGSAREIPSGSCALAATKYSHTACGLVAVVERLLAAAASGRQQSNDQHPAGRDTARHRSCCGFSDAHKAVKSEFVDMTCDIHASTSASRASTASDGNSCFPLFFAEAAWVGLVAFRQSFACV